MSAISVRVATTPRLLADLIEASLVDPDLRQWSPGDGPAQVTIKDAGSAGADDSLVVIELGQRVEEPLVVTIDGVRSVRSIAGPHQLRDLVIDLTHELPRQARPSE